MLEKIIFLLLKLQWNKTGSFINTLLEARTHSTFLQHSLNLQLGYVHSFQSREEPRGPIKYLDHKNGKRRILFVRDMHSYVAQITTKRAVGNQCME